MTFSDFKDIVFILASVGTFVSALIALFTIREIKKQRLSSYKPEIILDRFCAFFYAQQYLSDSDDFKFRATKFEENNQRDRQDQKKKVYVDYLLQNIGFGTAKYIKGTWEFDYLKSASALEKYLPNDYLLTFNSDGFYITKESDDDFFIFFHGASLNADKIDYILPEHNDQNGKGQDVPSIITRIFAYYAIMKHNLKIGEYPAPIFEQFAELPKPKLKVEYQDFNNKPYFKTFEFSISFVPNSFKFPDQDENDQGIFYFDVDEK